MMREDEPLWVEKYRPQTVADTILPAELKATLQGYVEQGFIPNAIFAGGPGLGKTTAALAMCNQLKAEYYFINSSMKGNIDTLRTDLADFASSVSFTGGRKYIILDEADNLNPQSTQPALRGFIEQFSRNCGFILTCNYPARILDAIKSRCPVIDFTIPSEERADLAYEFFTRIKEILKLEQVEFSEEAVAEIIQRHFPDWRKILNIVQHKTRQNKVSAGLNILSDDEVIKLMGLLKNSEFTKVREWCAEHGTDNPKDLFQTMYNLSTEHLTPMGQAQLALTLNKYEYNAAFVANQEINLVAAMVEIMTDVDFK